MGEWDDFNPQTEAPAAQLVLRAGGDDQWKDFNPSFPDRTHPEPEVDADFFDEPKKTPWYANLPIAPSPEAVRNYITPIVKGFGQGFLEGGGQGQIEMAPEQRKTLRDMTGDAASVIENMIGPWVIPFDAAARGASGLFRGVQVAGEEAGLPRDVVGMPEAFFGSPHPTGIPKIAEPRPFVRPEPIRPAESPLAGPEALPLPEFKEAARRGEINAAKPELSRDDVAAQQVHDWAMENDPAYREAYETRAGEAPEETAQSEPPAITDEHIEGAYSQLMDEESARGIEQARGLGVIGPERPSINDGTPQEVAENATKPFDQSRPEPKAPEDPDGWQARFDQFVGKLTQPKDVKQLIRNAASENDNFPAARQGDIPLQHVEDIAEAAGVDPSEINRRGLGRTLRNDQEVRVAMRLMVQATDNVKSLSHDVVADPSPENLIKFQESIMRRDLAVEQIVGMRAEWGRTGNVFQEFMRDVKDGEALDSFIKDKCPL